MYINIVFKCILYICIYLSLFLHILACTCIYIYVYSSTVAYGSGTTNWVIVSNPFQP